MMHKKISVRLIPIALFALLLGLLVGFTPQSRIDNKFKGENGAINFRSDAPLEIIEARSANLQGILNPEKGTFAFSVPIRSFQGFNSPLQREHFNENYMESARFPSATFNGRIIEEIDYNKDGEYSVRAKGQLIIHGIGQERIIKSKMRISGGKIEIDAVFNVPLTDHDIRIPKIVNQKIAEEIYVEINLTLTISNA